MRGYAICGERRSGSLFLCNILTSTGVLGNPSEYFCTDAIRRKIPDYPDDPEGQLQMIPKLATTPNGVYGLKLHAIEFDRVKGTRWAERLPSLSLIYLERRDVLGQAISFVRARQTEQWTSLRASKQEPTYDGPRINQTLLYLLQQQARWRYYFARNGGPRLHLFYELVAQSPQETVEAVGRMLGLTETPSIDPSQLRLSVQRDPLSDEWRQRFIAEFRDLSAFN